MQTSLPVSLGRTRERDDGQNRTLYKPGASADAGDPVEPEPRARRARRGDYGETTTQWSPPSDDRQSATLLLSLLLTVISISGQATKNDRIPLARIASRSAGRRGSGNTAVRPLRRSRSRKSGRSVRSSGARTTS